MAGPGLGVDGCRQRLRRRHHGLREPHGAGGWSPGRSAGLERRRRADDDNDADGEFVFTGLAAGEYIVQVTLPIGTLSTPATVQEGQTTTLVGELDVDCQDDNANGNKTEICSR